MKLDVYISFLKEKTDSDESFILETSTDLRTTSFRSFLNCLISINNDLIIFS